MQHLKSDMLVAPPHREYGQRILIVTPDLVGPIRNGGIGTANTALALQLAASGFRVDVLYTLGEHCEGGQGIAFWIKHYAQSGVRLVPLPSLAPGVRLDAPGHRMRAWRVFQWMREHADDYDLCIAPEWLGDLYYVMLARDTGVFTPGWPIIVVTHSPTQWAAEGNYRLPQSPDDLDLDFMERQIVARADVLVSPSAYLLDWERARNWQLPNEIAVIPNLMLDSVTATSAIRTVTVSELVFFGRLETRKGLELFLRALSRLPDSALKRIQRITFLGKRLPIQESGDLDGRIHTAIGHLDIPYAIIDDLDSQGALNYLLGEGRLAVIASLLENSPYTVRECLHLGIPFIASQVGGIPELVAGEDQERALFKPNPGALARLLARNLEQGASAVQPAGSLDAAKAQWVELIQGVRSKAKPIVQTQLPLVSVCLVHYERPLLLMQAVDSLRQQDYPNFEVILVDDGSQSSDSVRYLGVLKEEFAHRGWRVVRQDNAYLGAARNHAARLAKGEWLLFMDDDNVAKPHEISTFVRAAEVSGADILTSFVSVFTGLRPSEQSNWLWLPLGADVGGGLYRNVYGDANALVRKSVFDAVGGFTEDYGVGHEDWEFFQKAVQQGNTLELVPEPLFWYRIQKNGMLRSGDDLRNHARNARAAMSIPGLGAALGYGLHTHLQAQRVSAQQFENIRLPGMGVLFQSWRIKRHRFWQVKRQHGWSVAIGKTLNFLASRGGTP